VDELIASVRKRLEKRDRVVAIADERLNNLRENIILSLPHELRTPLTGILGFSDILMTDCNIMGADKISEMAKYIFDAAQRLYRLTENYLVFAQLQLMAIDAERVKVLRQAVTTSPKALIEDAAVQIAHQYQRADDLSMSVSDDAAVRIVEENLKKIVEELVDNAFKFSVPGKPVQLTCEMGNNQYRIKVVDEGRGFSPQQVAQIGVFMQFERKTYEQQGSGFGLMIAKKSAEIYDGDFHIESVPQQKTTVTLSIPADPVGEANAVTM
jgi:signal transduction histidine kinase